MISLMWPRGRRLSEKHKRKPSLAKLRIPKSPDHRRNLSLALLGGKLSEDHKRKIGLGVRRKCESEEYRKMLSQTHKGIKNMLGKRLSESSRRKRSEV